MVKRKRNMNLKETVDYFLARSRVINDNGCMKVKKEICNTYSKDGYLNVSFLSKKNILPRLVIKSIFGKKINNKIVTRHICNNPWCINQEHLFYGTARDNEDDKIRNGSVKGSKNSSAKLSEEQVKEIKRLLKTDIKQTKIAEDFKVTKSMITRIKKNKAWSYI